MNEDLRDQRYLGDGLYVGYDGWHIILWTDRDGGVRHWVALDSHVLENFAEYAEALKRKCSKVGKNEEESE